VKILASFSSTSWAAVPWVHCYPDAVESPPKSLVKEYYKGRNDKELPHGKECVTYLELNLVIT